MAKKKSFVKKSWSFETNKKGAEKGIFGHFHKNYFKNLCTNSWYYKLTMGLVLFETI